MTIPLPRLNCGCTIYCNKPKAVVYHVTVMFVWTQVLGSASPVVLAMNM